MRINSVSTRSLWDSPRSDIAQMEAELARATQEAKGRYADMGLHLGFRTGTSLDVHQMLNEFAAQKERNSVTGLRLSSTQAVLDQIRKDGESFLKLVTPGKLTDDSATAIFQEAQTKLQAFTSRLNESAGSQFLFAGIDVSRQPVSDYVSTPTSAAKTAVDAAFQAAFGFAPGAQPGTANLSGAQIKGFMDGPFAALFADPQWGQLWSKASDTNIKTAIGQGDVIETSTNANTGPMRQLAMAYTIGAGLGLSGMTSDAQSAVYAKMRELVGSATVGVTLIQADLGRAQAKVTDIDNRIDAQNVVISKNLEHLEEPDTTDISVQITELQTRLKIAYSLTSQLRGLSLVNYL